MFLVYAGLVLLLLFSPTPCVAQNGEGRSVSAADLEELLLPLSALTRPAAYNIRNRFLRITLSNLRTCDSSCEDQIVRVRDQGRVEYSLHSKIVGILDECALQPSGTIRKVSERWFDGDYAIEAGERFTRQQVIPIDPINGQSYLFLPEGKLQYNGKSQQLSIYPLSTGLELLRPKFLFASIPTTREKRALAGSCSCTLHELDDPVIVARLLCLRTSNCPSTPGTEDLLDLDSNTRMPTSSARIGVDGRLESLSFYAFDRTNDGNSNNPRRITSVAFGPNELLLTDFAITDYSEISEPEDAFLPIAEGTKLIDSRISGNSWGGAMAEDWPTFVRERIRIVSREGNEPGAHYEPTEALDDKKSAPVQLGEHSTTIDQSKGSIRMIWIAVIAVFISVATAMVAWRLLRTRAASVQ